MRMLPPLVDRFGRRHTDLRVSVTDRCNLRCVYCVQQAHVRFLPQSQILTFEEIERLVRLFAQLGIERVRLTGGEPLVRKGVVQLVRMLARVPGIAELALTTNGTLLEQFARPLWAAGLRRVNVSLDTLEPARFEQISRRDAVHRVMRGIRAAQQAGFSPIKLNALAIRRRTEEEIVPLVRFALDNHVELRFIEYMPIDAAAGADAYEALPAAEIVQTIVAHFGPVEPVVEQANGRGTASMYRLVGGGGQVGVIAAVTQPFCHRCTRLRLTADGTLRHCLFAQQEWSLRDAMRAGAADEDLEALIRQAVKEKPEKQGGHPNTFSGGGRAMYQIGG